MSRIQFPVTDLKVTSRSSEAFVVFSLEELDASDNAVFDVLSVAVQKDVLSGV